jgi:hypothetical protein
MMINELQRLDIREHGKLIYRSAVEAGIVHNDLGYRIQISILDKIGYASRMDVFTAAIDDEAFAVI